MFCTNCGAEIKDGQKFCANCGSPVNGASANSENTIKTEADKSAQATAGNFQSSGFGNAIFSSQAATTAPQPPKTNPIGSYVSHRKQKKWLGFITPIPLKWRYLVAAILFFAIIALWYLPVMKIELGYAGKTASMESASFAMGLFNTEWLESIGARESAVETFKSITNIVFLLLDIVPLLIAGILTLIPVFTGSYVTRRKMIFQKFVVIKCFANVVLLPLLYRIYFSIITGRDVTAKSSIGILGVVLIIFEIALFTALLLISVELKKNYDVETFKY